jgi:Spy/CpxP family protein refolding chaperone
MNRNRLVLGLVLLAATPCAAQHQPPRGGQPMQMPMMMQMPMTGMSPGMLLRMREHLGLTDEQVRRLEAVQGRAQAAHRQHMPAAMAPMHEAMGILQGERPDFAQYEAKLRQAAEHLVAAHVAMARAMVEARAVLTAEQQGRLRGGMSMMHEMMREHMQQMMGGMMGAGAARADSAAHQHRPD